jgi:serine kinase of HPr protein (carbohydrate metabolism regulator)
VTPSPGVVTPSPGTGTTLHGTAIAWHGRGVLLRGPSGSGKSDLALRLIAAGALLVADDQVLVSVADDALTVAPPPILSGLLEIRGVGLVRMPFLHAARLALVVDLGPPAAIERLPDAATTAILGKAAPVATLAPFEPSAVAKLVAMLRFLP